MKSLILVVFCFVFIVPAARSQTVISQSGRMVTDNGSFLDDNEERILERKLRAYNDSTSTQIVVVTLPDLGGYDSQEYALALGREWGVGQRGSNNGVVILISRAERAVRIETGYGLEGVLPDVLAGRIVRDVLTPAFKKGQFFYGINTSIDVIMSAASGEFEGLAVERSSSRRGPDPAFLYLIFMVVFMVISRIRNKGHGGGQRRRGIHNGLPIIFWGSALGGHRGGGFGGGGFGGGGFGGGGFGGFGGGGFGGGGAGGSW